MEVRDHLSGFHTMLMALLQRGRKTLTDVDHCYGVPDSGDQDYLDHQAKRHRPKQKATSPLATYYIIQES
ncbi:hypothetical protein ACHQM5_020104 [Ranunculus cassubicifolius]